MKVKVNKLNDYNVTLYVASDKSITHRAIMFNAFSNGRAKITNALLGEDCLATIDCVRKLGAKVDIKDGDVYVTGADKIKSADMYVGNSGTTIRLISGMLCGYDGEFTLCGDESLSARPMERVINPLKLMGANVQSNDNFAPLKIYGTKLNGISYELPIPSAQVKSAILLAGLNASGETTVIEKISSRNHTELMLKAMGALITVDGKRTTVKRSVLNATDVTVCGDISSASYPIVLACAIKGSKATIKNVGINVTRAGILEVLRIAGVRYEVSSYHFECGEPVADLTVYGGEVKPFSITEKMVPRLIDEIPVLAVLACVARGKTVISGAQELKVKESNRILTTVNMLKAFGADVTPTNDGMIINGGKTLHGGITIDPCGDHRIAMSGAVLGALADGGATILNAECANVSFPDFYKTVIGDVQL